MDRVHYENATETATTYADRKKGYEQQGVSVTAACQVRGISDLVVGGEELSEQAREWSEAEEAEVVSPSTQ